MSKTNFSDGLKMKNNSFLGWLILLALLIGGVTCSGQMKPDSTLVVYNVTDQEKKDAKHFKETIGECRPLLKTLILTNLVLGAEDVDTSTKLEIRSMLVKDLGITLSDVNRLMKQVELFAKYYPLQYALLLQEIDKDLQEYE